MYSNYVAIPISNGSSALTNNTDYLSTPMPFNGEIVAVYASLGTGNTGADVVLNTRVGTPTGSMVSQISATADKLTITAGTAANTVSSIKITNNSFTQGSGTAQGTLTYNTSYPAPKVLGTFTAGQTIGLRTDNIGSTVAGSALSATILVRPV